MSFPQVLRHGVVASITGSCHQLQMDAEYALLVDCVLFQREEASAEVKAGANSLDIEFSLAGIKAKIATYIDHVGRIPYLLAAGFKGGMLCSEPGAKLLPVALGDAFKLGFSHDQKQVEYYFKLIRQRIIALPYKTWFSLSGTGQLQAAASGSYSLLGLCGNRSAVSQSRRTTAHCLLRCRVAVSGLPGYPPGR